MPRGKAWDKEEEQILLDNAGSTALKIDEMNLLPGRSFKSIMKKRTKMGIKKARRSAKAKKHKTPKTPKEPKNLGSGLSNLAPKTETHEAAPPKAVLSLSVAIHEIRTTLRALTKEERAVVLNFICDLENEANEE